MYTYKLNFNGKNALPEFIHPTYINIQNSNFNFSRRIFTNITYKVLTSLMFLDGKMISFIANIVE